MNLLIEVLFPFVPLGQELVGHVEKRTAARRAWRLYQLHVGLFRRPPRFFPIAVHAGAHHVLPAVRAAPVARHHVVQRQVLALRPAVLAGIPVPVEDFIAGHFPLSVRPPDMLGQPDYGRQLDCFAERVDITQPVFNHLRFALVYQDDGAAGAAHGQRLVALVEHQHRVV